MESKSINEKKGIIMVVISTIIIAVAQLLLKKGALTSSNFWGLFNINVFLGLVLYAIATIIFIYGLKNGNLSTLYPVLGLGYIWVCLIAYFLFGELITLIDVAGIALIILGVGLLGVKKHE
ncbi:MAG: EamA family transporter [Candidatus Woesearchaeota archaeon]